MMTVRALPRVILLLCAFAAGAQGGYLEKGANGIGSEARVMWALDGFKGIGILSGYSIAGILDVGGSVDLTRGMLQGYDSTDLRAAFDYRINVLKQSPGVPLSLQIRGSYGLSNVLSEYLDDDHATRRGTGYTLGLNLSSNIGLTDFWLVRVGLLGDYGSTTYTTVGDTLNTVEREANLHFGGALGFLFVFRGGATLAAQVELRADQNLELEIHPILAVAFPQR